MFPSRISSCLPCSRRIDWDKVVDQRYDEIYGNDGLPEEAGDRIIKPALRAMMKMSTGEALCVCLFPFPHFLLRFPLSAYFKTVA